MLSKLRLERKKEMEEEAVKSPGKKKTVKNFKN